MSDQTPPNPLPCECDAAYHPEFGGYHYVVHCPLHAAGEKLTYGAWLVAMTCERSGEPVDGFRFREAVAMIRDALATIPDVVGVIAAARARNKELT